MHCKSHYATIHESFVLVSLFLWLPRILSWVFPVQCTFNIWPIDDCGPSLRRRWSSLPNDNDHHTLHYANVYRLLYNDDF